jgi:AAA15 family ATPase/GTPase
VFFTNSQLKPGKRAMLIEFSVGNYRSFKDKVTFSMVAANLVSNDFESNYIKGKYGAIPLIGNLGNLNYLIDSNT